MANNNEQLTHEEEQLRIIEALPLNIHTIVNITIDNSNYLINTNRLATDMLKFNINKRQAVYLQAIRIAGNSS